MDVRRAQGLSSIAPADPASVVAIVPACNEDMAVAGPGRRAFGPVSGIFWVA
jgi:hypothetical protein